MYDLIIVGGGPAGMTAAVYAVRKQMKLLLITREFGGQLMWTSEIENYMGYQVITGPELIGKFEEQVKAIPGGHQIRGSDRPEAGGRRQLPGHHH